MLEVKIFLHLKLAIMEKDIIIFILGLTIIGLGFYLWYVKVDLHHLKKDYWTLRYHNRFKYLPTKVLEAWLEDKKVKNEKDKIMVGEILKILAGRNNRSSKS